jgi:hypothetical protein
MSIFTFISNFGFIICDWQISSIKLDDNSKPELVDDSNNIKDAENHTGKKRSDNYQDSRCFM